MIFVERTKRQLVNEINRTKRQLEYTAEDDQEQRDFLKKYLRKIEADLANGNYFIKGTQNGTSALGAGQTEDR